MNVNDKVVLITGGARMGLAIGRLLGERGARLIFTYRQSRASTQQTIDTLSRSGISAVSVRCDVSDSKQVQRLIQQIRRTEKRLDGIVHLASIYESIAIENPQALTSADAHWKAHVRSSFDLVQSCLPLLKKSKAARVVLISDWTAASGRPRYRGYTPYYISKVGVKAVVEGLALELAPDILVNGIAPGPILPPPGLSASEYNAVKKATPIGRWGGPEEIARAVLFLMETGFVTGETIRVDGGRHLN